MKISTVKREYFVEIEVRKFTPKTIRSYRNNLNLFLRFCEEEAGITEVEDLSLSVVRQFSIYMSSKGRKGSYINGLLKVAKAFIQYCYDEGYGGFNTKKNFKWCKQDKAVVMAFHPSDVRRMMQSCKGCDFLQIRDAAVLTTLFETGIRCWELCCIQKQDIHEDFIIINGKNHKQRVVPITPILRKALMKYDAAAENYWALASRAVSPSSAALYAISVRQARGLPIGALRSSAIRLPSDSISRWTPLPSAMTFPLPGGLGTFTH